MRHFVYLTTNLINGKKYIGDHSTNNLNDGYLGSGLILREAFRKYGKQNFSRKILEFFDTREQAHCQEEKYIKIYDTISPNGYNLSPTGGTKHGGFLSEETKKKISKNSARYNKGKKLSKSHRQKISKNHTDTSGEKNGMFGVSHSKEAKEKNRIAHLKENLPEERLMKMKESAKKKPRVLCKYCDKYITKSMHTRWHGEKCKEKLSFLNET
jgi:group I intron endonuclease